MSWFIALPDALAISELGNMVDCPFAKFEVHESGNAWLVGDWPDGMITTVSNGYARVAVIGQCSVTATRLTDMIKNVRTVQDVDTVAARLAGSFHLIATVGGQVRIQGTISGLFRVYSAVLNGVPIASDRADVLAALLGSGVRNEVLALQLLSPAVPYPLDEESIWDGVRLVPFDHCLLLDTTATTVQRWRLPKPDRDLTEGARQVGKALIEAVEQRTATTPIVGADLSGGMDSTSLCFLASSSAERLITIRRNSVDVGNDDAEWGQLAAVELPKAEHKVLTPDLPLMYADITGDTIDLEQPYPWVRARAWLQDAATVLTQSGCGVHLVGHGGDELFSSAPTYLHTLMRQRPKAALQQLRGYRSLRRWKWTSVLAELSSNATYHAWLSSEIDQLTTPQVRSNRPYFGWGMPFRLPPWVTPSAVEAVRTRLSQAIQNAEPLDSDRAQHSLLSNLRIVARATRQASRMSPVPMALPYLDDQVIDSVLAVRLQERATPWRYKPLLAEAMRDIVPQALLGRRTKGEFGADVHAGLHQHKSNLLALFEDSVLASRGLIDTDVLRKMILGVHADNTALIALDPTLACEVWLQALSTRASRPALMKEAAL